MKTCALRRTGEWKIIGAMPTSDHADAEQPPGGPPPTGSAPPGGEGISGAQLIGRAIWGACFVLIVTIAVATPQNNHSLATVVSLIAVGVYVVGFVPAVVGAIADLVAIIRRRVHSAITPLFLAGEIAYLAFPALSMYTPTRTVVVSVTAAAGAGGTVTSDPPGISCSAPPTPADVCRAQIREGSLVRLRASSAGTWVDCRVEEQHGQRDGLRADLSYDKRECVLPAFGNGTATFRLDANQRP